MKWPKVSIWSLFRDDEGRHINNYIRRVNKLDYPRDRLCFYVAEGDSTDGTLDQLDGWSANDERVTIVKCDTGQKRYRHTTRPERLKALSKTGNAALEAVVTGAWGEYAMLLESDLQIGPDLLKDLLTHRPERSAIAPMIWLGDLGTTYRFYDIWAFRFLNEKRFPPHSPSWYWEYQPQEPYEIHSAGSVVLFEMQALLDGARYTPEGVIVEMCEQARELGYKIYCDPTTHVIHPEIRQ